MTKKNTKTAEEIIKKYDPVFKFRWEIYDEYLLSMLNDETAWLDLGCGDNSNVEQFQNRCRLAIGVDIQENDKAGNSLFVITDISHLPFADNSFSLLTLRFVVEHLNDINSVVKEIERVLKPGGKILIMTTNTCSPFIFIPRLLPEKLKNYIQRKIFKVKTDDIMPTFHRLNSKRKLEYHRGNLKIINFEYIQDTNLSRLWLFKLFFGWHLLTGRLKFLRTNYIAVLQK